MSSNSHVGGLELKKPEKSREVIAILVYVDGWQFLCEFFGDLAYVNRGMKLFRVKVVHCMYCKTKPTNSRIALAPTGICSDSWGVHTPIVDEFLIKSPPPVGAGGGYMFSGRPSVPPSVCAFVHDSLDSFMFPRYLQYLLTDFRQPLVTGASRDRDELSRFWGQKVKVQGHGMTECIP